MFPSFAPGGFQRRNRGRPAGNRGARRGARSFGFDPLEGRVLLAKVLGDFNADGYADLAVGVPGEDFGTGTARIAEAGAVHCLYGSAAGLASAYEQVWHQDSPFIEGDAEKGDQFGAVLTVGDFDGDGYADLAVGVPGEDVGPNRDAGAVNILYGSSWGLISYKDQLWQQDSVDIEDVSEAGDRFGAALATGDFNGDGTDDLAIGVPDEDVVDPAGVNQVDAGAVNVLYGSASGLTADKDGFLHQKSLYNVEAGDRFGSALAVGRLDGDRFADLAVGVPGEDLGTSPWRITDAGAVNIFYGHWWTGLGAGNYYMMYHQDGLKDSNETGDRFGAALAAGNFDADVNDELAVGVPGEDIGSIVDAGAVQVIHVPNDQLDFSKDEFWSQDAPDVEGAAEAGDRFGAALAVGDFNGDGYADLAVGVPDEDLGSIVDAGTVNVLYGSGPGLAVTNDQLWHQDVASVEGGSEPGDRFGSALAVGNFNGDRFADLVIGVPGEDIADAAGVNHIDAGAVHVLYGSSWPGLTPTGDQLWYQGGAGVEDAAEQRDHFGGALHGSSFGPLTSRDLYVNFDGANISRVDLRRWSNDWSIFYDSVDTIDEDRNGIVVQPFATNRADRLTLIDRILALLQEDLNPFGITAHRHQGLAVEEVGASTLFLGQASLTVDSRTLGIAGAVDFGNYHQTDIAFALPPQVATWWTTEGLARYMADLSLHEAGHTWGLYHVDSPDTNEAMRVDVAKRLGTDVVFRDGWFAEFEDESGHNHGGGRGPQNSFRSMLGLFVSGTGVPSGTGGSGSAMSRDGLHAGPAPGRHGEGRQGHLPSDAPQIAGSSVVHDVGLEQVAEESRSGARALARARIRSVGEWLLDERPTSPTEGRDRFVAQADPVAADDPALDVDPSSHRRLRRRRGSSAPVPSPMPAASPVILSG